MRKEHPEIDIYYPFECSGVKSNNFDHEIVLKMYNAADWSIKNNLTKEAIIVVDELKHVKRILNIQQMNSYNDYL